MKMLYKNHNTHFMFNNFFRNYFHLLDNVEKPYRAGQTTDDKMAHMNSDLDT